MAQRYLPSRKWIAATQPSEGLQARFAAAHPARTRLEMDRRQRCERDRKLLELLDKEGIRPALPLTVEARNYDQTVSLGVNRRQVCQRKESGGL